LVGPELSESSLEHAAKKETPKKAKATEGQTLVKKCRRECFMCAMIWLCHEDKDF